MSYASSSLVINRMPFSSITLPSAFFAFPLRGCMSDFAMSDGVDHPWMAAYYQRKEQWELKRMNMEDDPNRFCAINESTEESWATYYGRRARPRATTPTASKASGSETSPKTPRVR